jgi:hypothetical protein
MRENGALTAGEHRGHPAPPGSEERVADRVDAAMNAVQAARPNALPHRARTKPKRGELRQRDHAVLPLREGRYRRFRSASGELRLYS